MGLLTWQHQVIGLLFLSLILHAAALSSSPNISSFLPTLPHPCLPDQSLALLQLKSSFTIDSAGSLSCPTSYPKTGSWKEGVDCCVWDGVTCDRLSGHVIGLDLSCAWISAAPIDSNSTLFLLTRLQNLNLAFNFFGNSPIPSKFGQFISLTHLNLSHSSFTGLVPPEMALLSKLVSLDLSRNSTHNPRIQFERRSFKELLQNLTELRDLVLDGTDMSFVTLDSFHNLSSSIRCLSLRYSWLQGNFPKYLFQLPNLQELNLYANRLNGSLPEFNLSSPLQILDLSQTGFSGNLPSSIGNLKSLIVLNLEDCNGFVGSLPATIGNLTRTTSLILDSNNFTGQIPSSLSNLASLVKMSFEHNNFFGPLPDVFYNLTKLTFLGFAQNNLSGPIPSSIFSLNQLSTLRLFSNQLSGSLSHEVSNFSELNYVDLSHNSLNGNLPAWFFILPSLAHLNLSDNQLTGQLPEFLSKSLVHLILSSKNKIQGPVPSSIFELVNASYINLASNNFSGTLGLHMFSKILNLGFLDLSDNILSLEVDKANFSWPMINELYLSSCNITSFPLFLSNQSTLYALSLSRNKIHEIPILNNTSLVDLDLSHNCLTKAPVLHTESALVYVDISFNLIQVPLSSLINMIPERILWSVFLFSSNKFTGEIPSFICNKSGPLIIDLSNNSLSGKIPQCLGTLGLLSILNLGMNNLSGSIPQDFSNAGNLRFLDLSGKQLEGPLPQSLVNCRSLEVLDLGGNKFESRFPFWLESLPELQVLVLRSNRFHGPIFQTMSSFPFPKLRILDLSNNAFTGPLPIKYFISLKAMMSAVEKGVERKYMEQPVMSNYYQYSVVVTIKNLEIQYNNILTIFATMDLSNNKFEGQIPAALGNLNSLKGLNLSHNILSGLIPPSLANLTAIESLDFSYNKLVGGIPQQLANLNFLAVLNLSYNQLEGPIPQGNQFNTFNSDSYFGNPGLCGSPLTMHCGNGDAPPPLPSTLENDFSGGFDWKFVMMGYGSGLVIGLSIAYMVFARGEPLWFAKMVEMLRGRFNRKVRKQNRRHEQRRNS